MKDVNAEPPPRPGYYVASSSVEAAADNLIDLVMAEVPGGNRRAIMAAAVTQGLLAYIRAVRKSDFQEDMEHLSFSIWSLLQCFAGSTRQHEIDVRLAFANHMIGFELEAPQNYLLCSNPRPRKDAG